MTDTEWLASADPEALVNFLRGRASDRKLRLFACACCRDIWPYLTEEVSRRSVEAAEAFADGQASKQELRAAKRAAGAFSDVQGAWVAAYVTVGADAWTAAHDVLEHAVWAAVPHGGQLLVTDQRAALARFAHLLRDVIGNPFRPALADPAWLTWADGTVPRLAQAIYEGRRFEQLPILADALEEAGCADAAILGHCRSPAAHARGCWGLDLLLGKG